MKLKKLLAAVTAAALAVTTMAVTSFTASAADVELGSVSNSDIAVSELATATQAKITFNITNVVDDAYATLTAYVNGSPWTQETYATAAQYASGAGQSWQANHEVTATGQQVATLAFTPANWGYAVGIKTDNKDGLDAELIKVEFLDASGSVVKAYDPTAPIINKDNFTYSTLNNTSMEIGDSFTVSYNAANTPPAAKYSFKYKVPNEAGEADYYTPVMDNAVNGTDGQEATGLKVTSSTAGDITTYTFTAIAASAAEFELNIEVSASGTWSDTAYLWFGSATAYKVVGSEAPTPEITLDPKTVTVAEGETTVITITATNADNYTYEAESSDAAKATATVNGTTVTVKGMAAGTAEITVTGKKTGADDITATCTVTVTEGATPPDPTTVNLTFPTTPIEIPVYYSAASEYSDEDILASVEVPFAIEGNKTFEDVKDTTYVINGINFTNVVKDGKELDLKNELMLFTHVGGELGDGVFADSVMTTMKKGDKNKSITIDMSSLVTAENKTQKLEKIVLILSFGSVKDSGLAIGDKIYLNGSVTAPPAGDDKHTGSATITATNNWGTVQLTEEQLLGGLDPKKTTVTFTGTGYIKIGYNSLSLPESGSYKGIDDNNGKVVLDCSDLRTGELFFCEIGVSNSQTVTWVAEEKGGQVTPPSHTHTPAAAWTSDATGHWHACTCDEKLDFATHTSDGGNITTPATETTAGVKTYKCTVCKYVIKTEAIPATGVTPAPAPDVPSHSYTGGVVVPIINNGSNSKTPSISGDNGKSGWDAIVSEIAASGDGAEIVVDMNGATKVPSSIMREIEGLDIDLVLNMGRGTKWTINGLSVTGHKNIDFGVSKNTRHISGEVVSTVDGTYKKQISLDHNGTFGCTAALTVDIGTKYNGLYANLFYYNPKTKSLELTDCSLISGGNAKFMFTHASDYLVTVTAEPLGEFEDVSSAAGIASDNSSIGNGIAVSAVLAAIVLGFGIVVYRKRRHN